MGRTYCSKADRDKVIDFNVSGTQILDCLHAEIGVGFFFMGEGEWKRKMAKFKYTKKLADKTAKAIKDMSEEQIKKVYKQTKRLFGGSLEEFKQYITEWADFLETSGGCDTE